MSKEPGQLAFEVMGLRVGWPDAINKEGWARVEAAIRADERAKVVPAGHVVAPVEPTEAMLDAAYQEID
jgi:hypothetical protein